MSRTISLNLVSEIPPGEGRTFASLAGFDIAVFRARSGALYASQAMCPHKGGPLADGLVGGASVVCPLHEKVFDLRTGSCADGTCAIAVYPVTETAEGRISVELPS